MSRLLVVFPTCPAGFGGGGQRWDQLSAVFAANGWRVVLLDPNFPIPDRIEFEAEAEIRVLIVAQPRPGTHVAMRKYRARGFIAVYDLVDDWTGLNDGWYAQHVEADLCKRADFVTVTCPALERHARELGARRIVAVPNAGDPERFNRGQLKYSANGPNRAVGYFGSVWGSWFNHQLIAGIAKLRPRWTFDIIGQHSFLSPDGSRVLAESTAKRALGKIPNVHLRGIVPHERLAAAVAGWSVALIPFKRSKVIDCTDPVKAYEYLLSGLPVVSTRFESLERYRGNGLTMIEGVDIERPEMWVAAIEKSNPPIFGRTDMKSLTWQARKETLLKTINEIAAEREAARAAFEIRPAVDRSPVSAFLPAVSVVIPSWRDCDQLKPLLLSLKQQTHRPADIIVVDNQSDDGTAELCQAAGVTFIEERSNISTARNLGARAASSELIAFTDCGCRLASNWLESLTIAHRPASIVGSVIYNRRYPDDPQRDAAGQIVYACGQSSLAGFLPSGSSMLISRADFEHIGGFDPDLYNGEDTEFDFRVLKRGLSIIPIQARLVEHDVQPTRRELFTQFWKYGMWDRIANRERDRGYATMAHGAATTCLARAPLPSFIQAASYLGWENGRTVAIGSPDDPRADAPLARDTRVSSFLAAFKLRLIEKERVLILRGRDLPPRFIPPLIGQYHVHVGSFGPLPPSDRRWCESTELGLRDAAACVRRLVLAFNPKFVVVAGVDHRTLDTVRPMISGRLQDVESLIDSPLVQGFK